jgi:chitodextrinase
MVNKQFPAFCNLSRWFLVAALLAWSVSATALWGATINVPGDHSSIQAAHDAASSGDTVLVAPGTYNGQITVTKAITLASHFLTTGDESFIGSTILDGGGPFVISIPAGAEDRPTIQGFTIQNSRDGILPNAMFNLLNCLVRDTSDGVDYESGSGGLVQFCTFELNSDDGIDLDNDVEIVIADSIIRNNDDDGIEIRMQDFSGPTKNIIITGNQIHGNGQDGIQLIHYDVLTNRFFEITHNFIYNNTYAGIGMMDGSDTMEDFRAASIPETIYIFNNTFANNSHGITGGDNTVVLNNIFVDHPAIAVKNVDANSELASNLFFNNGTDNSGSNVNVASSVFSNPFLTESLELPPGSPAIDAGRAFYVWQGTTVLDLPPGAFFGSAPDMGAFEFDSGGGLPPDPPLLVGPPHGSLDVSLTPTLEWSGDGDNFTVQVATDATFDQIVDAALVSTTQYTVAVGALDHLTTYFWRVNASNAIGTSGFSAARNFTTAAASTPPDPPILLSPSQGTIDVPLEATLAWTGTAEDFDVQVATDAGFLFVVFWTNTTTTTTTLPSGTLDHETEYYWRVRGNNAHGEGDYSAAFVFTTVPPPDTISPSPPLNLRSPAQTNSTIDLLWDASTDNVGVVFYKIHRDGVVVATESSTNHTAVGLNPATSYDFQVSAVDGAGNESLLSDVLTEMTQSLSNPVSISAQVGAADDDAEERLSTGSVKLRSSDLELNQEGSKPQAVGIRFQNIAVPWKATIQEAYIQFTVDEIDSGETSLEIRAQAADNPGAFTSTSQNITSRPTTAASVNWAPPAWNTRGESGPDQRTPDLSGIVQEIVNRKNWGEGNAMVFVITGSGERTAESFNGDSSAAPILTVTYVVSMGPAPPEPPLLLFPADGATNVSLIPSLSWEGVADTFNFEVASDPLFNGVVALDTVATTSVTVPSGALADGTIYYWRVQGTNSVGTGAFSAPFSFTTIAEPDDEPPNQPQNLDSPSQTGTTIDLTWDASTDNVGVVQYNVYRDDLLVASVGGTSFTDGGLSQETWYNYQVAAEDGAGNESLLSDVLTAMTQSLSDPVSISMQVGVGDDDAEERLSTGVVNLSSSDLELNQEGSKPQAVGIRFQNVAVPWKETIREAYIQFTVDETDSRATLLEIRAQAADNPEAFTSSLGDITSRPTTAVSVNWAPPVWNTVGESGPDQRTPDLSGVVQEIVNRDNWVEGNAMVFVITGFGERTAEAFDGREAAAPILTITY